MRPSADSAARSVVSAAIGELARPGAHFIAFSLAANLLLLTGSLYMMQVYDRVLHSRSLATLFTVSLIALAAYALYGLLDHVRMKMLGHMAASIDAHLSPLSLRAALAAPGRTGGSTEALRPFRDLEGLRNFLSTSGPAALVDLPLTPVFMAICFILHPWLGWLSLGGLVLVVLLTLLADLRTKAASAAALRSGAEQLAIIEEGRRNTESVTALGMTANFERRFLAAHTRHVGDSLHVSSVAGGIGSFAKALRFVLQSAVIGLGAILVIRGEISGGSILAASILSSRALAPIDTVMAHWKGLVFARQGYARLRRELPHFATAPRLVRLPSPSQSLIVEDIVVTTPASGEPILNGPRFELRAGQALGLIGPSGSGKSTLARVLVGICRPVRGVVRLDAASIDQWESDQLGRSIGYLPQDVELLQGTVASNIARLDEDGDVSGKVIAAAKAAGAHDLIVGLPQGYETLIGDGGTTLSGGQRQRIALARALYGDPFLVVLDEPNASLDAGGDAALAESIRAAKARGAIAVVITHRPSGLAEVDLVGVMSEGRLRKFGPRDAVLAETIENATSTPEATEAAQASAQAVSIEQLRRMAAALRGADAKHRPHSLAGSER